ncbi:hypothetical protein [[Mycoplasma] imitans]|uniref:hypothetical protein n=1 Tax=[Mycoplasma] imitans TaxID=29560 RepID=UPI0004821054|nr:hypothetical protein [[Mycoplasma] imitans]
MVNDNNTVNLAKLSNYLSNLISTEIKPHCSLIKKQNGLSISSFTFLLISALLVLLLTVNVFIVLWTAYNSKPNFDDKTSIKLLLEQFNANRLISHVLFGFLLIILVSLITLISFGFYFNNHKKLDTPIKEIKRQLNFVNRVSLVCACITLFLAIFGFFVFFNFCGNYEEIIKSKKTLDDVIEKDSTINTKTLISGMLGIFFCFGVILLFASILIKSVFSVQYSFFTSLSKLKKAIVKLDAETVVVQEEKVEKPNEQEQPQSENVQSNTQAQSEPSKEEVKPQSSSTPPNNEQKHAQTKANPDPDLDALFKKFNKQTFSASATQTQAVDPNNTTKTTDQPTTKINKEQTVKVDPKTDSNPEYTSSESTSSQQSYTPPPTSAPQTEVNSNQTKETKVNDNPTKDLKDVFKKMHAYTKTQEVNNQTTTVDNNQSASSQRVEQTTTVNKEDDSATQTATSNVNPADLYKNIFKFKSPLSGANDEQNLKHTQSVQEENKDNIEEELGIGVKTIKEEEKQKEELKNLFKKMKDSKE